MLFLWNNSFSMRQIEKYPRTKMFINLHFYVYGKFENYLWNF